MLGVIPLSDTVNVLNLLLFSLVQNSTDILSWVRDFLSPDNALQHLLCVSLILVMDYPRAIDQINSLSHCNILPNFCLSRDGRHPAAMLFHKSVNNRTLTNVWVSDQANRNIFLIFMKDIELFQ